MDMQIDILTLFPESVDAMLNVSILGRAQERGYIAIRTHQIRAYTTNKQMQVDDYPYGGGRGAVMQADPLFRCWEHVVNTYGPGRTIFMSPCGRTFTQSVARELKAQYDHLILVCGHYEGIDQRFIDACVDEELSMGDFVLTGGEIPAMAVADAVCRMVPGVLLTLLAAAHWNDIRLYAAGVGLSLTGFINLATVYSQTGTSDEWLTSATSSTVAVLTGLGETVCFVLLIFAVWDIARHGHTLALPETKPETAPPVPAPQPKWTRRELGALLALTAATAVLSFSYLGSRTAPQAKRPQPRPL